MGTVDLTYFFLLSRPGLKEKKKKEKIEKKEWEGGMC